MILYQFTTTTPRLFSQITQTDIVLFRQDAVYLLCTDTNWPTTKLFALQQDLRDRNLQCPDSVTLINDTEWVELCLTAQQVVLC
jgi:sulfur relay protein TusB/DsrH